MSRRILCWGDSNTYGYDPQSPLGGRYPPQVRWTDQLAALRPGREVWNWGENGREILRRPWELQRLEEALQKAAPVDGVVIMLGSNDLLQMSPPRAEVAEARMGALIAWLQARRGQGTRILLTAPPPMRRGAWVGEDALVEASRTLAQRYRALAGALGIPFADAGAWEVELAFDGVHFTPRGHQAFGRGMDRALRALDL